MKYLKLFEQYSTKIIAYHGSPYTFDTFKINSTNKKQFGQKDTWVEYGIFFTDDYETAEQYSIDRSVMSEWGKKQREYETQLEEEGRDDEWMEQIAKYDVDEYYKKGKVYKVELDIKNPIIIEGHGRLWSEVNKEVFNKDLTNYDGIIINNVKEMKNIQTTYVVFTQKQVKIIE